MSMIGYRSENHPQQTAKRGALDEVDDRGTDATFFAQVSARFGGFTFDVAAAPHNAKCQYFYTRSDDGLLQPWPRGGRIWCNPPYSRVPATEATEARDLGSWVRKAWLEWNTSKPELIVMLVPANRVEQAWWQDWVEPFRDKADSPLRVEFLRGRLRFDQPQGWVKPVKGDRPPFGCALLIWSDGQHIYPPERSGS